MDGKRLRLRYGAACDGCGTALHPGTEAWWYRQDKVARCLPCAGEVPSPPAPPPPPPPPPPSVAGGSAQAEYDRRNTRDRARMRATRVRFLVILALAPVVGYALVRLGITILNDQVPNLISSAVGTPEVDTEPTIAPDVAHTYGIWAGLGFFLMVLAERLRPKQSTEAWRVGADGERKTATILRGLGERYEVLHDLRMPNGRGNIDHVVVGPTGVFTIETKNYKNGVVIKGGVSRSNGRKLDSVVDQARRQADALSAKTGVAVTPIVCVHGGVEHGLFDDRRSTASASARAATSARPSRTATSSSPPPTCDGSALA